MTITNIQISQAVNQELDSLSSNLVSVGAKQQFQIFLTTVQPEIDEAISEHDSLSLSFIQDRIAAKFGEIVIDAQQHEKAAVTSAVFTALNLGVRLAIMAALA